MHIAVDTGGTFTDFVASVAPHLPLLTHKRLSTPDDPAQAVLDGIRALLDAHSALAPDAPVTHGSTVATNALLEGKTGRAAFVTTRGFEDTLHIARQNRPDLYALRPRPTRAPIPRAHCVGVAERVAYNGAVLTPLSDPALRALVDAIARINPEAVAVSLLHSYANADHEARVVRALREAFGDALHITASHRLLPEPREYERGATCAVNALVAPRMTRYLDRLGRSLGDGRLAIMGSAGGTLSVAHAQRDPVHTVLSGPAGGVVGALAIARSVGYDRIITFDMGGTSTDVALCDGDLTVTHEGQVGPLPIRVPLIDIHTVGAGGGSIARVDPGGALRVGPESAGADPGPACYRPAPPYGAPTPKTTVTDANLALGRLLPDRFLGGAMALHPEASRRALGLLAQTARLDAVTTAEGVLRIAEATMARAVKVISIERGHDPRDFALVTFGGAGGLHACNLAELLGMRTVVVPAHPGLLSAVGMRFAPRLHTLSAALMLRIAPGDALRDDPTRHPALARAAARLTQEADARLERDGVAPEDRDIQLHAAVRYAGQSYELSVPLSPSLCGDFTRAHRDLYSIDAPGRDIELVALRARATGRQTPPNLPALEPAGAPLEPQDMPQTPVTWSGRTAPWPVLARDTLRPGHVLAGPALISELSSTTLLPPGWAMRVHSQGHLILERAERAEEPAP